MIPNDQADDILQAREDEDDWHDAYVALVLDNDNFDADEAVLLLKLLENPDLLRESLEAFVRGSEEEPDDAR